MNVSINANYFTRTRKKGLIHTHDECIKLCVDAGFRFLDYSFDVWCDGWESEADEIMNAAAKYGAVIEQSHAPYNFYSRCPMEVFLKALDRSADAAIRMGIRNLVFHADEYHPTPDTPYDANIALQQIYEILAPCIEKTVSGGVRAALETVFEDHYGVPKDKRSHFCGDIQELIDIIDKFNDPMVGCCWDFGHAKLAVGNDKHTDAIRQMGNRIICTHVHDNYYGKDLHLPPFMGDANWEELMPALKQAGYDDSLTFELVYGNLPDEQVPAFLKQLYYTGTILSEMFEG